MTRIGRMRQSFAFCCLGVLAGCGGSPASPGAAPTATIISFSGSAPVVTADQLPIPHPYPQMHLDVRWPDDVTGLNEQIIFTIFDSAGAVIARSLAIGPVTKGGAQPAGSMGAATYAAGPFQGTVLLRMSAAPCGSACTPSNDFCAPGGVNGGPACKTFADLPAPYLTEITRTIALN